MENLNQFLHNSNGDELRLIVVSNRLPVTVSRGSDGEYEFKMSSGGLVSALSGCKKQMDFTWIGWLGIEIPREDREHVSKRLMDEYSCQPVFLPNSIGDKYYNGFSNEILWPLFHYHPGEMNFDEGNWHAYREANAMFAHVVREQVRPGDMVWIQDYHLMLLPMMLRGLIERSNFTGETNKELDKLHRGISVDVNTNSHRNFDEKHGVKIGWFLHTPFPSSEIYRSVLLLLQNLVFFIYY